MLFSEKHLVDLYCAEDIYLYNSPMSLKWDLGAVREYALPSGRRCDLYVHTKNDRIFWVIEFKILAEPSAIKQAIEYRDEIYNMKPRGRVGIRAGFVSVAAQFFKPETLFFADQLGVECIQLAPLNYEEIHFNIAIPLNKKIQHKLRFGGVRG
jgi:hypothetical protein